MGEKTELELNEANVKPMTKNFKVNLKKGNVLFVKREIWMKTLNSAVTAVQS